MSFKALTKPEPKRPEKNNVSIDTIHSRIVSKHMNEIDSIADKQEVLENLEYELMAIKDPYIKMVKEDEINILRQDISRITSGGDLLDYYMDAGDYLYQYHENTTTSKKNKSNLIPKKLAPSGSILSLLKKKTDIIESIETPVSTPTMLPIPEIGKPKITNEQLVDKYMTVANPAWDPTEKTEVDMLTNCELCGTSLVLYENESRLVCTNPECGVEEQIFIGCGEPSYKEPPREQSSFPYRRINHFNEWLAQFQAKESTEIPDDVYDKIKEELHKEHITNFANLSIEKLRHILKKLNLSKYYEHVPHIISRLNGISPPVLSAETEQLLRHMFKEIQLPFNRHRPVGRKNFLSYSYVLYKFCELLEMDDFLSRFTLLKSRDKLVEQDNIWRLICRDLDWQFIKSV